MASAASVTSVGDTGLFAGRGRTYLRRYRLHVSDIYTKTFTEGGHDRGRAGASVRLQREDRLQGGGVRPDRCERRVRYPDLPIGHYRYLARCAGTMSAPKSV